MDLKRAYDMQLAALKADYAGRMADLLEIAADPTMPPDARSVAMTVADSATKLMDRVLASLERD